MGKILLHIGCGNDRPKGFINTDKDEMDITKPWPYADESVDGIISMQVLQQLYWRDLVKALREAYRVLKKGGVMRSGIMLAESEKPLDFILGFKNINLFSKDLLKEVFVRHLGFTEIKFCSYRESLLPELAMLDNRSVGKGTFYFDALK